VNILFFGSSSFSLPVLETLFASGHKVTAVVTTPAKPKGRGLKVEPNPVQALAREKGVPCLAPAKLRAPEALEEAAKYPCDVMVLASYGKILPGSWLALARISPLNMHPSLLPRYRGAAPINWQIIDGAEKTGVTIFKMEEGLDSGDIAAQQEFPLGSEQDALMLSDFLAQKGAAILLTVLARAETGTLSFRPQDPAQATYAPKLKKEDGVIHWNENASRIAGLVRGLLPWPTAYTYFQDKPLQVLKAEADEMACATAKQGEILEVNKSGFIRIQTGQGSLLVQRLKPAGKREMSAGEFANGYRIAPGMHL
jgi:methionyl-tRNA formyltransferase